MVLVGKLDQLWVIARPEKAIKFVYPIEYQDHATKPRKDEVSLSFAFVCFFQGRLLAAFA